MIALAYKVIRADDSEVEFRIVEQSDILTNYLDNRPREMYVGKLLYPITFESVSCPEVIVEDGHTRLYLRGADNGRDTTSLVVRIKLFDAILVASALLVGYCCNTSCKEIVYDKNIYYFEV